jgi:hypothetical protein
MAILPFQNSTQLAEYNFAFIAGNENGFIAINESSAKYLIAAAVSSLAITVFTCIACLNIKAKRNAINAQVAIQQEKTKERIAELKRPVQITIEPPKPKENKLKAEKKEPLEITKIRDNKKPTFVDRVKLNIYDAQGWVLQNATLDNMYKATYIASGILSIVGGGSFIILKYLKKP